MYTGVEPVGKAHAFWWLPELPKPGKLGLSCMVSTAGCGLKLGAKKGVSYAKRENDKPFGRSCERGPGGIARCGVALHELRRGLRSGRRARHRHDGQSGAVRRGDVRHPPEHQVDFGCRGVGRVDHVGQRDRRPHGPHPGYRRQGDHCSKTARPASRATRPSRTPTPTSPDPIRSA